MKLNPGDGILDLWHGRVHMHTAFWLVWFTPIAALAWANIEIGSWFDLVLVPFLVLTTVSAWRSTNEPPGALWAASMYRLALFLFGLLMVSAGILIVAGVIYGFFQGE